MEINEHYIKLTGKACIPEELELGYNFKMEIDGEITAMTSSNNQDGTKDVYYKFVPILAKVLKNNGEVIKAKDNRTASKKFRNICYKIWESGADGRDYEQAYQDTMRICILKADEIYDQGKR